MMDDGTDYMMPIPIFVPQLRSPINNQTDFQQHQQLSPSINEDANRNHLMGTSRFYLHLTFNGNRGPNRTNTMQMASQSMEEEARRCQEQLDASRQTLSRLEAEVAQLERVNDGLRSDNEVRELVALEQGIKRLEEELAECRNLAIQSTEDLALKTALASATRTKRFETECSLRELQLSICRRKFEYATARVLDNDDSNDEDPSSVMNLPEEEERIMTLQNELQELNQSNNRAMAEVQEAERLNATRQNDLARTQLDVEQRIAMGGSECESRRQNLTDKRQQLERNLSYLITLGQEIAREKLKEIETLQFSALIEAARKVEQLERSAQGFVAASNSSYNG